MGLCECILRERERLMQGSVPFHQSTEAEVQREQEQDREENEGEDKWEGGSYRQSPGQER